MTGQWDCFIRRRLKADGWPHQVRLNALDCIRPTKPILNRFSFANVEFNSWLRAKVGDPIECPRALLRLFFHHLHVGHETPGRLFPCSPHDL